MIITYAEVRKALIDAVHSVHPVHAGVAANLQQVVVYDWRFDDKDQHVLDAILANPPKRIAVSVFTDQPDGDQQAFCHQVLKATGQSLPDTEVTFFDSWSTACWSNP